MELQSQINTFTTGMDLDSSLYAIPNTSYRYASNIRILTDDDGSFASLNQMDTIYKYKLSLDLDGTVIGVATGKSYNYAHQYTNVAYLMLRKEQLSGIMYNSIVEVSEFDKQILHVVTICEGEWNISNEVQMVFNYEDDDLYKLYITDGNTELKVVTISDGYNRHLEISDLSFLGRCLLESPVLTEIISGSLPVGQVQYCYQLFGKHGIESTMSPVSDKIPVTPISQSLSRLNGYTDEEGLVSQMGVTLQIKIHDASEVYNGIRLYRINYLNSIDVPTVFLINESQFDNTGSYIELYINDTGYTAINEYTLEEFNSLVMYNFIAQTICKKDNRLFAANITENTWDVNYDTRAYRCNKQGQVKLNSVNSSDEISASLSSILNGDTVVPSDHDCINPLNGLMLYPLENDEDNYSYVAINNNSSYVYGGAGPNVSFYFLQGLLTESDNTTVNDGGHIKMAYNIVTDSSSKSNTYFTAAQSTAYRSSVSIPIKPGLFNYGNPEIGAKVLSYQRDEIYRFGAVLYNDKGVASPVHWIADIRFPSADCYVNTVDNEFTFRPFAFSANSLQKDTSGAGYPELSSRPLGIQFEFVNVPSEVKAIEIVRCRRTQADRTVVTQGALSKVMLWDAYRPDTKDSNQARPFSIPGFAQQHAIARIGADKDGDDYRANTCSVTFFDNAPDLYDFTSADQCFNKDTEIIRNGDFIVPLYVATSSVESTTKDLEDNFYTKWLSNAGVQFQAEERRNEAIYDYNYTGAVVEATFVPEGLFVTEIMEIRTGQAITDGFDSFCQGDKNGDENWVIPASVFKYFKFYDKSNATGQYVTPGGLRRKAAAITAVKIPTNIPNTEAVQSITDIEGKYLDAVGNYVYENIAIGSAQTSAQWGNSNDWDKQPEHHTMWGIRGITTLIQSEQLGSTDETAGYIGIDTETGGGSTEMINDDAYGVSSVLICNIKRNASSQYGGNSYFSRSNSVYNIHCGYSTVEEGTFTTKTNIFGGDTFLTVLDHTHSSLHYLNDVDGGKTQNMRGYYQTLYPLESSVNTYLRSDRHFLQTAQSNNYGSVHFMTEPGVNALGSQSEPMYTYNSAYSNTDGAKSQVQKGVYDEDIQTYINRIVSSDVKTNNEITDSWTKFRYANYLDVDNQYGPITNLIEFNGRLFYFQDDALGIAQVNERSLITDQNNAELVLGTGTILGRYDYVVLQYGDSKTRDKSIVTSTSTMYWFDYDKNILCAYNNSIVELSKQKKVQSRLNSLTKENKSSVTSMYDNKYNEVWFKVHDSTLVFNEQLNAFSSFYLHTPDFALRFSDYLCSIYDNNIYYIHNTYNIENNEREYKTCELQIVVNQNYPQTKVYDNVFFDGDFTDLKTIKEISFTTKTQTTDPIDYTVIDNREDTYRFFIPREHQDNPSQQEYQNMSYAARMRGKYLICDYTFDCNDEKQMEIPFIKTTYRNSLV